MQLPTSPTSLRAHYLLLLLPAALLASGSGACGADGACQTCPTAAVAPVCVTLPRPQDQLWLVSDRSLGCTEVDQKASNLHYWHYEPGRGWQSAASAAFFAADDPAAITTIWIHGNQISHGDAFQVGWTAYSAIARKTTDERPLRFVIWSWPSERTDAGLFEDVRIKASRTGPSSLHLARFIDAMSSEVQVTIMAYSFGARIATGTLHLLGGGSVNGRTLTLPSAARRPQFDVVLIAAALDNDWLLPGHCHGRAMKMVRRMLLVTNGCDRVLERYHWLYGRRSCAEALGYTGLVGGGQLGADRAKITQFDACCYAGPEHDWSHYFASPSIVARIVPIVFHLLPPTGQPVAKQPAGDRRGA